MAQNKSKAVKAPTGAILSKYLRMLALDIETTNADGDLITKAEALAALVWKHALGFEDVDPDNPDRKLLVKPAVWAVTLLYDRIEGKVPLAVVEDQGKSLADKVSDLGKARINALAEHPEPARVYDDDDSSGESDAV
jgi:hypothetical protein